MNVKENEVYISIFKHETHVEKNIIKVLNYCHSTGAASDIKVIGLWIKDDIPLDVYHSNWNSSNIDRVATKEEVEILQKYVDLNLKNSTEMRLATRENFPTNDYSVEIELCDQIENGTYGRYEFQRYTYSMYLLKKDEEDFIDVVSVDTLEEGYEYYTAR